MYRIWSYAPAGSQSDEDQIPYDLDFKTGLTTRLHPNRIFEKGVLVETCYHSDASHNPDGTIDFGEPVVRETFEYLRDAQTFAQQRTQSIEWFLDSGEVGPDKKILTKLYTRVEGIQEGVRRRNNVIDQLKIDLIGLLVISGVAASPSEAIALGQGFFTQNAGLIQLYLEISDPRLSQSVETDQNVDWLDRLTPFEITFRSFIIDALTFTG